ncbi:acyltransferase family protein [Anabaena sp. FACHB-1237]|uniref:acyltransferase family protein n=1 Tax=Anabaena sp. FACHB-1237 TaxID=2692769 RepID=UPI0016811259|nr:acyltransferase family protein [Anabaena sp. FACHB-1237]MBD2138847.1 acyltransferase family protein [Anabaena sp. FACHB-1237]
MNTINIGKIYGFDYLRAVCCILVVAIHSNISGLFWGYENIYEFIVYNIFNLAVPIFMQTALVLFFINRQKYPNYFWNKRLFKIIKLYLFWGMVAHIFNLIFNNAIYTNFLSQSITWRSLISFIIEDGYGNPFYFFSCLLFMTMLAELVVMLIEKTRIQAEFIIYPGLILSCITVFLLPLIPEIIGTQFKTIVEVANPLNFIPYVFSSFLITQCLIKKKQANDTYQINYLQIFVLLFMIVIFIFIEWKFFSKPFVWEDHKHFSLSVYTRLSLVFSAWLVTLVSMKISSIPQPIIKLFSDLSLGIYALHTFIYIFLQKLIIGIVPDQTYLPILLFTMTLITATFSTKVVRNFRIFQDVV